MKLAGSGPDKDPGRIVRIFIHHSIPIHLIGIAAAIATYAPSPWISWGSLAVVMPIWLSGSSMVKRHYRGLCETCVNQMPDRGSEEAEKHDLVLRMTHFFVEHDKWFRWAPLCLMVPALALTFFLRVKGLTLAYVLPSIAINGSVIYLMVRHGRLQPWCPYCRTDGGDDDTERVPDPEPVMVKTV